MRKLILENEISTFKKKIYLGFACFVALCLVFFASIIAAQHDAIEREAKIRVSNLANSLGNMIEVRVEQVRLALYAFSSVVTSDLLENRAFKRGTQKIFASMRHQLPFVETIRVVNELGHPLAESNGAPIPGFDFRERPYFIHHQSHNDQEMLVSKPFIGEIVKKPLVVFSQRVNKANGQFGGVVLTTIAVDKFHELIANVDYQTHGYAVLRYEDDQRFLVRSDFDAHNPQTAFGNTVVSAPMHAMIEAGQTSAAYHLSKAPDGFERMNAFVRIKRSPFFLIVSEASDDYLLGWQNFATMMIGIAICVLLMGWLVVQWLIRTTSAAYLQEIRLRTLFELSAAGIVRTNMKGEFIEFNHAFVEICGYSEDEIKTLNYWQLTPEKFKANEQRQLESMERIGRYGPYRKQYMSKAGTLVDVELVGMLVKEANGEVFVWSLVTNITKDLQDQDRLRLAKEKADAANMSKSQFLATMSHELRTPLNGILGMAQLLARPGVSEVTRIEFSRIILSSGNALASLLSDLLDVSQMDANKLVLRPDACDVAGLTMDVATLFNQAASTKNLDLQVHWDGVHGLLYRVDAVRLRQMLSNLISNAIKFTPRGFVHVRGFELERSGTEAILEFSVQDSGVGIPLEKQDLLFKRFSQIENSAAHLSQGTGLGLSIIQGLARRMGGSAGVESAHGKGARFWFRIQVVVLEDALNTPSLNLPSDQETASAVAHVQTQANPLLSVSAGEVFCLVVEDNPINQKVIQHFLIELKIRSVCVENGLRAVQAIEQGMKPNFILMDVQMPIMNGLQATQKIRQWEKAHHQPRSIILGLTAGAADDDKSKCLGSGMDDVLFKPVDLDNLESKILTFMHDDSALSLDNAMGAHIEYKLKLRESMDKNETLEVKTVQRDDCCKLGKWLHGPGSELFAQFTEFADLKKNHANFHVQAGLVVQKINDRDYDKAKNMLGIGMPYADATDAVCRDIVALKARVRP